jgi:hypothetical protein
LRRTAGLLGRIGRVRFVGIPVLLAVVVGIVVLVANPNGGRATARRASLSRVQRAIHIAVSDAAGASHGAPTNRSRTVRPFVPKAPARVYTVGLSGSAPLFRSYPQLEHGASASAKIRFVPVPGKPYGRVCWQVTRLRSGEPVSDGAIHQASVRLEGAPVIDLRRVLGAPWRSHGCTLVYSVLMIEIAHRPADFYLQLDTAHHPEGALRGQL